MFKVLKMLSIFTIALILVTGPVFADVVHDAVESGNLTRVKAMLNKNPQLVNQRNQSLETPLHTAVKNGNVSMTRLLISMGADLRARDMFGDTPLFSAKVAGYRRVAELLLPGGPMIFLEVERGSQEKVTRILAVSPSLLNARDSDQGSPLHWAAIWGDLDIANLLISRGARIEAKDYKELTPAHWAAGKGNMKVVALLMAKGANPNSIDALGRTPLHYSSYYGHRDVSNLLISKGANVNRSDKNGETPLHLAVNSNEDTVSLLMAKGADVNARDTSGNTPLFYAMNAARVGGPREKGILNLLLRSGANLNIKNDRGISPRDILDILKDRL